MIKILFKSIKLIKGEYQTIKINKFILVSFALGLVGGLNPSTIEATETSSLNSPSEVTIGTEHQLLELKNDLKELFPEYTEYIEEADKMGSSVNYNAQKTVNPLNIPENPEVTFVETRPLDDENEYSLIIYSDGSYASMKSWMGRYTLGGGGSTNTGTVSTQYYNRILTVFHSFGHVPMIISNISYTINWYASDHFNNFGTGFVDGVQVYHYGRKQWEDSSGPAYSGYSGSVPGSTQDYQMVVELRIGSNTASVYLNNVKL